MFGAVVGLVTTAMSAGKSAGRMADAQRRARNSYSDAKSQYSQSYDEQYQKARGDTRDGAILQQLANTGAGSAGSYASQMSQMGQRAGVTQANANLAAQDAARGFAGGIQNQQQANASSYNTYMNQSNAHQANLFGELSQTPAAASGLQEGIGELIGKNGPVESQYNMAPQMMGQQETVMPYNAQNPANYSHATAPMPPAGYMYNGGRYAR